MGSRRAALQRWSSAYVALSKSLYRSDILKLRAMRTATLKEPYKGYRNIILIEYWPNIHKWEVEICGSGKHIFVYEEEFEED